MIINLHFGYKNRHHVYYDTDLKRGTLKLWTSQYGSMHSAPIENDEGFLSGLLPRSESQAGTFLGADQHTEFQIADEKDILSILTSLTAVINGNEFSFTSKEGRKITLSREKAGKREKEVITLNVQYSKVGKLTMGEAHKLQAIAKEILGHIGYSEDEIQVFSR